MKRFDFVYKHYANDIKERPDGEFVRHQDLEILIKNSLLAMEALHYEKPSVRQATYNRGVLDCMSILKAIKSVSEAG